MPDNYVETVMNEYFKFDDTQKAIHFLVKKGLEAGQRGNFYALKEIFGIGHTILKNSGVEPAKNAFVLYGTRIRLYCWHCDKMVQGENETVGTLECKSCGKTFCPSHVSGTQGERRCPFCATIINNLK